MEKVSVKSLNKYFDVCWDDFICIDDEYEQPKINQPWNKGKKGLYQHTEESKKKITGRPSGFNHTDEWKNEKSISMIGENNHFYGKKHTEDTNRRITSRHRKHYRFIKPNGEVLEEYTTIREISRKYKVCHKTIRRSWLIEELGP